MFCETGDSSSYTPPLPPLPPASRVRSSFFQSVCVLGYCVFPLLVSAVVCLILSLFNLMNVFVRVAVVLAGFVWATRGMHASYALRQSSLSTCARNSLTLRVPSTAASLARLLCVVRVLIQLASIALHGPTDKHTPCLGGGRGGGEVVIVFCVAPWGWLLAGRFALSGTPKC